MRRNKDFIRVGDDDNRVRIGKLKSEVRDEISLINKKFYIRKNELDSMVERLINAREEKANGNLQLAK